MLYIVATPIGNLGEITYRAVEVLGSVDYILCEDTRTSKVLLNKYDIKSRCVSYHKFNENEKVNSIISDLQSGKDIALISDAGMPGISDPGNILVNKLKENNIPYTVVSGPSALINAFVLSGYGTPFTFVGFLPEKNSAKKKLLEEVSKYNSTLIFYISPHNLTDTFDLLSKSLGDRECAVVREISKMFEEISFTTLSDGFDGMEKGEFVLVVKANENVSNSLNDMSIHDHVIHYMNIGHDKNDAIKLVAKDRGVKKNDIYKATLDIK